MLEHLIDRIQSAKVVKEPFTYFHLENVFPEDVYQEILEYFPETAHFQHLSEEGTVRVGTYNERFTLPLSEEKLAQLPFFQMLCWTKVAKALKSEPFIQAVLRTLQVDCDALYPDLTLISDMSDYAIGPHTDYPQKMFTLLFYLPQDTGQRELGTSVYEPTDPDFRCEGFRHHPFEGFKKIYTAPFVPNSLFGFVKSDRSFHGVEPIGRQDRPRNLMSYQCMKC